MSVLAEQMFRAYAIARQRMGDRVDPDSWSMMTAAKRAGWFAAAELAEQAIHQVKSRELIIYMHLWCPGCGEKHLDVGEFETKPHHTHACQHCGLVWRPAIGSTCGVQFLPGFKNETP